MSGFGAKRNQDQVCVGADSWDDRLRGKRLDEEEEGGESDEQERETIGWMDGKQEI